jgi:hypothetical protein
MRPLYKIEDLVKMKVTKIHSEEQYTWDPVMVPGVPAVRHIG